MDMFGGRTSVGNCPPTYTSYALVLIRFDHRPFLYNIAWPWQFRSMDGAVALAEKSVAHRQQSAAAGSEARGGASGPGPSPAASDIVIVTGRGGRTGAGGVSESVRAVAGRVMSRV